MRKEKHLLSQLWFQPYNIKQVFNFKVGEPHSQKWNIISSCKKITGGDKYLANI